MTMMIAAVLFAADPVPAPWDMEARLAAVEKRLAALEAKCQCGNAAKTPVAATPMQTVCTAEGCFQVSASGQVMNQGGCSNGQCPPRSGFRLFGRRR